jgi:hypothetical protein
MRVVLMTVMGPIFDDVCHRGYTAAPAIITYMGVGFPAF